jgi:glycosyltransferase involved in cell wall biosynthesis
MTLHLANTALRTGDHTQAIQLYVQALQAMPSLEHIITPNLILARKRYRTARHGQKLNIAVCFGQERSRSDCSYNIIKQYKIFGQIEGVQFIHPNALQQSSSDNDLTIHNVVADDLERFVIDHPYDVVHIAENDSDCLVFAALSKLIWGAAVLGQEDVGPSRSDAVVTEGMDAQHLENIAREMGEKPDAISQGLLDSIIQANELKLYTKLAPNSMPRTPQSSPHVPHTKPQTAPARQPITNKSTANAPRILFILPGSADSNNGYQVQLLARMLQTQGRTCDIAVPDATQKQDSSLSTPHNANIHIKPYSSLLSHSSNGYSVIHAWTPRELVRTFTEKIQARHNCPLIIHLEDNEEYLTEVTVGKNFADLANLSEAELDKLIPENRFHPIRGKNFLAKAQGLTMVIETLNRFNHKKVPYQLIPPMVDERLFYPRPLNRELRTRHNIPDDTIVLAYTGNVHAGNKDEVFELYKAVDLLNQQGTPTVLLRSGQDKPGLTQSWPDKHVIFLGWIKHEELPTILAAADILIQPGKPGPFNDERIPCKLPEYFAMGRPVILPKTNLGLQVEHGKQGYVLDKADAEGIAQAVRDIQAKPEQIEKLAVEAMFFYRSMLYNPRLVDSISTLYAKKE